MQTQLCEEYCEQSIERDEILVDWKVMTYTGKEFSSKKNIAKWGENGEFKIQNHLRK